MAGLLLLLGWRPVPEVEEGSRELRGVCSQLQLLLAGYSAVDRASSSENAAATSRAVDGSGRMTLKFTEVCQLRTGWVL
jgi:hypothetical protein